MSTSLESLYETAAPIVFRRCRQMLGRDELAVEATHWVFVRALEVGFVPRSPSESLTWLYTTATRRCLTVLRDDRRRRELRVAHAEALVQAPVEIEGAAVSRDLLERALRRCSERVAEVALLTLFQGLPVARAAELLDVSERTVIRARKDFEAALRALHDA